MKELLIAIKTHLRADANLSYIDDANIIITPDLDIIPITLEFPAIALKEDNIHREDRINIRWKTRMAVFIVCLQLMKPGDISIIGQADPKIYGVLDMANDIHTSLNDNTLSITGMQSASPSGNEQGSETVGYEDLMLQRKIISYEYLKNESQP